MNNNYLSTSDAWLALEAHKKEVGNHHMRDLFSADPDRIQNFSISHADFFLDYSKHFITKQTIELLINLAEKTGLQDNISALFNGDKINTTEKRAALHTALRNPPGQSFMHDGVDLNTLIQSEMGKLESFVNELHSGHIRGYTGQSINTVINIGIGGSDLGPRLVVESLESYRLTDDVDVKFVSNLDAQEIYAVLEHANPETSLFIVTSKSFTTLETFANAETAKTWLLEYGCTDIDKHFVAVSSNLEATGAFGISDDRVFQLWDWVGGRYSVWSTVGLPVAIALGMDRFREFQQGAHEMDQHFRESTLNNNIPVILALLDIWYNNFFNAETLTVVPYDQRLRLLPDYLSQLIMESNGKSVSLDNKQLDYQTSHIVWGSIGTNSQHAYFQMLHQGTRLIPVEFLLPVNSSRDNKDHHKLVANCLAQSKALMLGKENPDDPHRHFPGNNPSTTIMYDDLNPRMLGMLLAMYEHRTFVQASIWGINAFDQWGVELGKILAKEIIQEFEEGSINKSNHDASTLALMQRYMDRKNH
jgi:glucose-6-phosphate isomerase